MNAKAKKMLSFALIFVMSGICQAGSAVADDVYNNIDSTIDANWETMNLSVGSPATPVSYSIRPTSYVYPDYKPGCNIYPGQIFVATAYSNNPSVAYVPPTALIFDSCSDVLSVPVMPMGPGTAVITLIQNANSTGGYFELSPATFTVNVSYAADTTPPVIVPHVTPGPNGAGWNNSDVTVFWSVSEDRSPILSASGCETRALSEETNETVFTCSATSAGGTASQSVTVRIDKSKPIITGSYSPAPNAAGWNNTDVTVGFDCAETGNLQSGLAVNSVSGVTLMGEGGNQSAASNGVCVDMAGNVADPAFVSGINIDKTAPNVMPDIATEPNAYGWYKDDVVVNFLGNDGLSGIAQCDGPVVLNSDGSGQSASGKCSDNAGNVSTQSGVSGINIDKTAPLITLVNRTPANAHGWNNTHVNLSWYCSDPVSGVVSDFSSQTVLDEGTDLTATGICTDLAGNTVSDTQTGINIDKTAPLAAASVSPTANAFGWYKTDVTVAFSGTDSGSGIDSCSPQITLNFEGADQSASGFCTDLAGNKSLEVIASDIDIDKTDPFISWMGEIVDNGQYYFGSVPSAPTCTASDSLSGLNGDCTINGYSSAVGSHTLVASASDNAGNSVSESRNYTVSALTLSGFAKPIDMEIYNVAKSGSTIPFKFEIFAGQNELTDISYVKGFTYAETACDQATATADIETVATGGTTLRYDPIEGQFVYNWKTPGSAGKCYRVTMTAIDNSSLVAYFKLK